MAFPASKINRYRVYQTRCNICGRTHEKPGHVHFFEYETDELHCCEQCIQYAPGPILRKEYWDRIYAEPDAGHPLWRYVELPKFLDLVLFKRLWLTQVAALDDAFEGALGARERQEKWRKWMHDFCFGAVKNPPPGYSHDVSDEIAEMEAQRLTTQLETSLSAQKNETYVSCWQLAKHESFLMWKVYAGSRRDSVCIKTNMLRLRKCLNRDFKVGLVRYIDFKKAFPDVNWLFLFKRAAFSQESEVRVFIRRHQEEGPGLYVHIDPQTLIDEVLLSPEAPYWLADNIKRVVHLSGLDIRIRTSDLDEEPF